MAKVKTQATLSPSLYGVGQEILTADVQTALGAQGYVVGECVDTQANTYGYLGSPGVEPSLLLGAGTPMRSTEVWVPAHAQSVVVGVEIELGSGSTATGEVSVTVGGATALTFARAGVAASQPATQTVLTGDTGTGWVLVEVEGEVSSGTDTDAALGELRIECEPIAAGDLADPPVE